MAAADGSRRASRGLSGAAFRERSGTEEACRQALFAVRWREGLTRPACGHRGFCRLMTRKVFRCDRRKKQPSLAAGTVLQDTELPLTAWCAAIYQLTRAEGGISPIGPARRRGVRRPTAWLVEHEPVRATAAREAAKPKLAGRVEVDDARLGGERSGGERGRGAAGEAPFVAALETTAERRPKRLRLTVVGGFREREVEKPAERDFAPGSDVVSDGLSCWPAVEKAGCPRRPMVTGSGERAATRSPFRRVGTTLGNATMATAGTHHHVSAKHARSYPTGYACRSDRRFRPDSIVERLAWAAVRTAPQPYRVVTADV